MSQCYPKAREKFLTAQLNWMTGDFRAVLLPQSYVPDFTDEFLADIIANVRIATSDLMEDRTATNGFAYAPPIKFPALLDNRLASQAVIYKDTGDEATSPLVFYMSEDLLIGAPFALEGLDYFIYPDALEGGYFRL
jgi:hypothetical protein